MTTPHANYPEHFKAKTEECPGTLVISTTVILLAPNIRQASTCSPALRLHSTLQHKTTENILK
jgi:hypothetical protein